MTAIGSAEVTATGSVHVSVGSDQSTIALDVKDAPLGEIIDEVAGRLDLIVKGRPIRATGPLVSCRQSGTLPEVLERLLSRENYVLSSCELPSLDDCRKQIHFLDSGSVAENPLENTVAASPVGLLRQPDAHHYVDVGEMEGRQTANNLDYDDEVQVSSILMQRAEVMRRPRAARKASSIRQDESLTNDEEPVAVDPVALMNDPNIRRHLQQTTQQAATQLNALVDGLHRAGEELALSK